MHGAAEPRRLDGLDALGDARQVIVVANDEARAALSRATGRTVVAWPGGEQGERLAANLAGRNVVIWPDADRAGLATADEIACIVSKVGATLRVLDVMRDDPPSGWNAATAIDAGWGKEECDRFMRDTVCPWTPPTAVAPKAAEDAASDAPSLAGPTDAPSRATPALDGCPIEFRRQLRANGGAPILDPRDPMPSARLLMSRDFLSGGLPTLHHYRGSFWYWNGSCFRDADSDAIASRIWKFFDGAKKFGRKEELMDFAPVRSDVANCADALKAVANLPADIEAPTWLGEVGADLLPREMLPVRNGLLHLPTGRLVDPSPAFFCTNASDVPFDPAAPAPHEWLKFLNLIWPDDPASVDALQDVFGYLLSADTSQQKIPLIVGPKRSGKGTIARVLTAVLGQDSVSAPTLASLATNFGLAPLIGKSVAIIGDARLSGKADQAAIAERLLSISGEDAITVDRKFLPAWTGRLGVRFVIMSNELPRLSDASGALASRFVVLTMTQSFYGKEDRGLGNRLLAELPGILNWSLEGYRRLRARGYFVQPESARDAIEELEELGSPIAAFLAARCTVAPGLSTPANDLFAAWREWCEVNGRREPGTVQSFGRDLRAAVPGLRISRPRVDGSQVRRYEGIDMLRSVPHQSVHDW